MFGWLMNLLGTGGVRVLLGRFSNPLKLSNQEMKGGVLLKTGKPRTVLSVTVKVIEEWTTTEGEGDHKYKDTKTTALAEATFPGEEGSLAYPLELKPGEDREQPFDLLVFVTDRLHAKARGGVIGGISKLASFAACETIEYYVVAEATVTGQAFASTAKEKIKVVE